MADVFTSEQAFEDALVSVLEKDFGWKNGTLEHPSEQDLLDNWAQILFENNRGEEPAQNDLWVATPVARRITTSIPTQTDMNHVVLGLMQDGKMRSRARVRNDVASMLAFTNEELGGVASSGKPVYASRTGWTVSYLDRAQLLGCVSRSVYQVNDEGRAVFASGVSGSELFQRIRERIDESDP